MLLLDVHLVSLVREHRSDRSPRFRRVAKELRAVHNRPIVPEFVDVCHHPIPINRDGKRVIGAPLNPSGESQSVLGYLTLTPQSLDGRLVREAHPRTGEGDELGLGTGHTEGIGAGHADATLVRADGANLLVGEEGRDRLVRR